MSLQSDKSDQNSIYGSMDLIPMVSLGEGGNLETFFPSRENSRDFIYSQSKFNKRSGKSNPDSKRLRFASVPESESDLESQQANQRLENQMKKKFSFHM